MYGGTEPLWRQWEQACDFLEADLESGYVRVLQEMIAAGWSDPALAASVREQLGGWFRLLTDVARREDGGSATSARSRRRRSARSWACRSSGPRRAILLGFSRGDVPTRAALRKIGVLLRGLDVPPGTDRRDRDDDAARTAVEPRRRPARATASRCEPATRTRPGSSSATASASSGSATATAPRRSC